MSDRSAPDYDKAIADAARGYVDAQRHQDLDRHSDEKRSRNVEAYEKLTWMINAEQYGWHPDDYASEADPDPSRKN